MAKQVYRIVFGSKDERSANSTLAKKQGAILKAWKKGGGQKSATDIAESATEILADDGEELTVSQSEVAKLVAALKETRPERYKTFPAIKAGQKGARKMVEANDEEFDEALDALA